MRRRVFSGRRQSIGAKFLILCTVAVFVAGMAATMAETKPPQKGGSKSAFAGDVSQVAPGVNSLSLDRAQTTTPGQSNDGRSVLAGCNTTVLVGGQGTSGNERAPNSNFLSGRAHYLITPAEMAASGFPSGASPTDITWAYTVGGIAATGSLKVYMENTGDTSNLKSASFATAISTMTLVSNNPAQSLPTTAGSFTVPFVGGAPFTYTGGGLYVAFDWLWTGPVTSQPAVVDCNTALVNGLKGNQVAAPTDALAASSFRPFTRLTPSTGTANDVSVDLVRSYGVVPTTLVSPHTITAVVSNKGTNVQNNVPVNLAITGADTFANGQSITTLAACGGSAVATFGAWTPSLPIGSDTATVTVPADDNNANNSLAKAIDETNNRYSYKHPGSTASGGVGLTGASGAFVAMFSITQAAKVSQVELEFFAVSATTYKVAIYGDNGGMPSTTALYVDAVDRTVGAAGPIVITLPSPVSVPAGKFYVGLHQTNTTNASISFDAENPIRSGSFFLATALPPAGWVDFSPGNNFKLNIGVKLIQCSVAADCNDGNVCTDDACVNELCSYSNNTVACSDGNPCTGPDSCGGGVCQPGPNPCNDNLACTNDICDGIGGCTYTAVVCNDNNPCTADSCAEPNGCVFAPQSGPACSDGNACTVNDSCVNGVCQPGPLPTPVQFCSPGAIAIPATGTVGAAGPYPATIVATGISTVCKVTVQLNGFFHTWPADTDILLEGPQGQNAKIMSDVGGGGAAGQINPPGINLNLDDAAGSGMTTVPLVSGTFKPTDLNASADPAWPAPAPVPIGGSALSIFNGTSGAGSWNIWARDQFSGDSGGLSSGWCLTIVGAPCQNNAQCDDHDACTGTETCNNGVCQTGTPVNCNDGQFCTLDSCNPSNGQCVYTANPCDDLSQCTTDTCDEINNVCVNTNACVQFCASGSIAIPEGGAATPYPSTITVSNTLYPAIVASVEIRGFTHTFPDDVDVLIEGPVDPSQNLILFSDAGGGTPATNVNLTFTDAGPSIPDGGPMVTGTYKPSNYAGGADAFPAPAPANSGATTVATLNGNPNGTFKLYVIDEFTPDSGSIADWCLNILPIGCTDASECDDGNFCTEDACVNGGCTNTASTSVCDDFNPCTTETCSQADGCGYLPVNCDDGLACTTDSCVDFQGCQFTPNGPADPIGNTVTFTTNSNLDWTPEASGPYNVYRGTYAGAMAAYNHTCFSNGQVPKTASDGSTPASGTVNYYLVSRDNACGESNLGTRVDSGVPSPRPNAAPCP